MKKIILLLSLFFSLSFYGQNDTLSVVRHTDKDIITPKNLKVVYRGIPNELFIDVPNAKSFEVSGNGITKKDKNTYNLNPAEGIEAIVTINIILKSGKKITENQVFKIRSLPSTSSIFNGIEDRIIKLQKSSLKNGVVSLIFPDKNLEKIFKITKFTLKISGMGPIVIDGNKIDDKMFEIVNKKVSQGDQLTIYDIKTSSNFGAICILTSPIIIQIL